MSLPLFSDIGKQVKDLFEKNFFFDCVKLEMKNSLTGYMSYKGNQAYSIKDGKMTAEIEGNYESDGVIFTPKITTDSSVISGDVKIQRSEFKGATFVASGNLNPQNGKKSISLGCTYSGPEYNIELGSVQNDPNLKANGILFRSSGVIKYK